MRNKAASGFHAYRPTEERLLYQSPLLGVQTRVMPRDAIFNRHLKISLLQAAGKRRQLLVEPLLSHRVGAVRRNGPRCISALDCVQSERGLSLDRRAVLMYLQLVGN